MKNPVTPLLFISLVVAWDFLFWNHGFGVNILLFILLLIICFALVIPQLKMNYTAILILLATITAGCLVAINNTYLANWTVIVLAVIAVGFVHHASLRSAPFALGYSLLRFGQSPGVIWQGLRKVVSYSPRMEKVLRYHKLFYLPVFIAVIFLVVYSIGDPQFAASLFQAVDYIVKFLESIAEFLSVEHLLFILFGMIIAIVALIPKIPSLIVNHEMKLSDFLQRKRKRQLIKRAEEPKDSLWFPGNNSFSVAPILSLRNEYRRGIITLVLINLLLLSVNVVDVSKVWFEGQTPSVTETIDRSSASMRSASVHDGVNALIFSIFLAMAVLLFFFRGNINFLQNNKWLRQLAYVWIVQNVFLAITVVIRNSYYIHDYGLTMKRIGVFAFLCATTFGLLTFYLKIRDKRSSYYLVRINSWAVCGIFLLLSFVDWDPLMAKYNIAHLPREKLDRQFILWLNDHTLPVIISHTEIFFDSETPIEKNILKQERLKLRIQKFIENYESSSWQSWNFADYRVYKFLTTQKEFEWKITGSKDK